MAYNKEYYEEHKDKYKKSRDKYRNANRLEINKRQNLKYASLTKEEKEKLMQKQKEKRRENVELSRLRYKIYQCNAHIKKYEEKMFMLNMKDTWDSLDYKYSDKLQKQINHYKQRQEELLKEKEKLVDEGSRE